MSQENPLVRRYLGQLEAGLVDAGIHEDERHEIRRDIESHISEATGTGTPLVDAIGSLGSAAELVQAYCLELSLNPRRDGERSPARWVAAALSRAGALLASTLITIVMGSISIALLLGGVVAILGGIIAPFLSPAWLDPTLRAGLPQAVVIAVGVLLLAAGIPFFRLVRANLRLLVGTIRKDLKGAAK